MSNPLFLSVRDVRTACDDFARSAALRAGLRRKEGVVLRLLRHG
jgi:hypothetical protein